MSFKCETADSAAFAKLSGAFYRIVPAAEVDRTLQGARSPEGRYHHDSLPALYLSPRVDWAERAVEVYRRASDTPRVAVGLWVEAAMVVDLRDALVCSALGIHAADAAEPWQPQRRTGEPATSWHPADMVRTSGADGMIYPARSGPERWHLVLFRWNEAGGPRVTPTAQITELN